jgi:enamine deaminase RidA (YjgF/YER057c/UK114 family)
MDISYLGITEPVNDLPIISKVVVYGDSIYTCGVTADPTGDITEQTQQVLDRIDRLLRAAGTDKSRLLTAQVWLRDMSLFAPHNAVWNAWVDPDHPPVRVCVAAELWQPSLLVEIMVTAARQPAAASS